MMQDMKGPKVGHSCWKSPEKSRILCFSKNQIVEQNRTIFQCSFCRVAL